MSRIELVFERLHVAVQEQMAALESCPDPARWPVLGAYVRCTIGRLDGVAVLIVVRATRGRSLVSQRSIAAKLDALHGRAEALLAGIQHGHDMETRRFATRLAALDPLASARSGPDGLVDLSEKVVTGVPISAARRYCTEDGGPLAASHEVLAGVTIRDADLRMAQLSRARLLDLDARGVSLDGATAIEAQLARVNLAGASMQDADMQAILARDCDFSRASLAYARWDGATAIRCSFNRAELADLSADRAVFLDCDFRGADLAVGELGAPITMTGAQFVRCDLRWSRWCNRTLAGVRFVGCKLHGVIGRPLVGAVVIDRPDLSPDGDGSWIASLDEVLALWENASSGAEVADEVAHGEAS